MSDFQFEKKYIVENFTKFKSADQIPGEMSKALQIDKCSGKYPDPLRTDIIAWISGVFLIFVFLEKIVGFRPPVRNV